MTRPGTRAGRAREVRVELGSRSYSVAIGNGVLDDAGEIARSLDGVERAAVVSDSGVPDAHIGRVEAALESSGLNVTRIVIPSGESAKNTETLREVLEGFASARLHRPDVVFAVGGGVTGDVAGFAAAVYLRGIALVQCPTTLLAMVDSSVGGKTGINLPAGKNLVGAVYQPIRVLADTSALETLPESEVRNGLAEVIKYGLIADPELLEAVASGIPSPQAMEEIIERSVKVKARVVSADEHESGERAYLNYGHTVGHALEALAKYGGSHGEAIAVGMVFAAALARELGYADLTDLTRNVLEKLGLPVAVEGVGVSEVLEVVAMDKKYLKGLRFVLLEEIGSPTLVVDPPRDAVIEAFREVGIR